MTLSEGTRLGPYEITAAIGAGGMGEVYRAKDTKLNRDVAIEVLPALFANDTERLARFTREAQALATLNHPNIAHIHGLEEAEGVRALVMELVEGEDLSQRMEGHRAKGLGLPLDAALPIARQIADALEAAHELGIVHRDLKPANIKVRADGTVKVLDFGLAKAMDPVGGSSRDAMNSPTLSVHATMQGVILGTAAYMAPEQARGKAVDKRADIWAFGVVLYEMLTGTRAFSDQPDPPARSLLLTQQQHGQPISLPNRMTYVTTDMPGKYPFISYPQPPSRVEVFRIESDGTIGAQVKQSPELDGGTWAHMVRVNPSKPMVILVTRGFVPTATDPGMPGALKIYGYKDGVLTNRASIAPNGGVRFQARHLDFHPSGQWVYLDTEAQNKLEVFKITGDTLSSEPLFSKNTLEHPDKTAGQVVGPMHLHPNGRFAYVRNRRPVGGTARLRCFRSIRRRVSRR